MPPFKNPQQKLIDRIDNILTNFYVPNSRLSYTELLLKKKCEKSFYEFIKAAWHTLEGHNPYIDNWHIKVMCDHLQKTYEGKILDLIINVPPNTMKSTVLVLFNAWVWTNSPNLKFLCLSGDEKLAFRDSLKTKRILTSKWYTTLWGESVVLLQDVNSRQRFENTYGGYRIVYSFGQSTMGERGDFTIIDDGNPSSDILSDNYREKRNIIYDECLSSRVQDTATARRINVQQRLHKYDLSGHILSKNIKDLVHLFIPMKFEIDRRCVTHIGTEFFWQDPRNVDGALLWPQRWGLDAVEKQIQIWDDPYTEAGQFQQRPSPREGGMIKKEWFKEWNHPHPPESFLHIITSWDTAHTDNNNSAFSACTTWGLFEDDKGYNNLFLLNAWKGKLLYPDLKEMIKRMGENIYTYDLNEPHRMGQKPDRILIERAANGISLIDDLRRSGIVNIQGFDPKSYGFRGGDSGTGMSAKEKRASLITSIIEQGMVWLPKTPPHFRGFYRHASLLLEACTEFPRGDGKDLIDSMSQAFIMLIRHGNLFYRGMRPDDTTDIAEIRRVHGRLQ